MRTVAEWKGKNDDARIPDRVKDRVAHKAGDCCQKCHRAITEKLRGEFDHVIPLIIGAENRESNLQLLCNECHAGKTKLDVRLKAKVARARKCRLGLKKPRTITRWRLFDGSIREAGRER